MYHTTDPSQPAYYIIWRRTPSTKRWVKAGRTETLAEAVTLIGGKNVEWWFQAKYLTVDERQPSLPMM